MSAAIGNAVRQLVIPSEIALLGAASEELGKAVSELADRLESVLRRPEPRIDKRDTTDAPSASSGTPLVDDLRRLRGSFDRESQRIRDLLQRLEL